MIKNVLLILALLCFAGTAYAGVCQTGTFGAFTANHCTQSIGNAGMGQTTTSTLTITSGGLATAFVNLCQDAGCANSGSITVSSVTGTLNTWNLGGCVKNATNGSVSCIFYAYNAVGGTETVTAHASSSSAFYVTIGSLVDWGGILSSGDPLDQTGTATGTSQGATGTVSTGSSTAVANELVYSAVFGFSGSTTSDSIGAGYSTVGYSSPNNNVIDEAKNGASQTTYSAGYSFSPNSYYAAVICTFKPAGAASKTCTLNLLGAGSPC